MPWKLMPGNDTNVRFGEMEVEMIKKGCGGTDLTIVNAARVSFNKESEELQPKDEKLIKYLAEHNHWTPFGHGTLQFRIKAPIFVARQLVKHQVGLVWNEVSRRYVDDDPDFFMPEVWRANPDNVKQGSSETETISELGFFGPLTGQMYTTVPIEKHIIAIYEQSLDLYKSMIRTGVCAEQARMVLPAAIFTEWYWTGSLYAFARVCNLRCAKDTQKETRYIANRISEEAQKRFPVSWKYLKGEDTNDT